MRRLTASLLTGVAVAVGAAAWMAFAAGLTVLDPDRSERIADVLIEEPVVRDAAAGALSRALQSWLPAGSPVPAADIDAAAHRALEDPRALAALRAALVGSHQRLVGRTEGPVHLDGSALAAAGRDALVALHPDIARALPAAPTLAVDLPTDDLPDLGGLVDLTGKVARTGALVATLLLALAFLVSSDRPRVLSRAGRWAITAGLGWAAAGWLLPYGISRLEEPSLAVLGTILVAVVGPMLAPAVTLVTAGTGALFGARAWRLGRLMIPGQPDPPSCRLDPPVRRRDLADPQPVGRPIGRPGVGVGPYASPPPVESGRSWKL